MGKNKNDNIHAIMALDPGGTSGLAAGYFDIHSYSTLMEILRNGTQKKAVEVEGTWIEQAWWIAGAMSQFVERAHERAGIPFSNIHIVIEDFILRRKRQGGATGDLTSVWVAAAVVGAFGDDSLITWQQPSEAKGLATNSRLQMWEMYEVGSEHRRDANRHIASKVNKLIGG